jgi:hypothetical protein
MRLRQTGSSRNPSLSALAGVGRPSRRQRTSGVAGVTCGILPKRLRGRPSLLGRLGARQLQKGFGRPACLSVMFAVARDFHCLSLTVLARPDAIAGRQAQRLAQMSDGARSKILEGTLAVKYVSVHDRPPIMHVRADKGCACWSAMARKIVIRCTRNHPERGWIRVLRQMVQSGDDMSGKQKTARRRSLSSLIQLKRRH